MRVNEFLNLVVQETRAQLPSSLRTFHTWKRYTLVQLYYSKRSIHYEVWVRGGNYTGFELTTSGTAPAHIVFAAFPGELVQVTQDEQVTAGRRARNRTPL